MAEDVFEVESMFFVTNPDCDEKMEPEDFRVLIDDEDEL